MTIIHSARPKHYKNKEFLAYTFNMIRKIFKGYRFEKLSIEVENQVSKINKILKKKNDSFRLWMWKHVFFNLFV